MTPRIVHHLRLAPLLALLACATQVFSLSLPSLVVCYRVDRPPQIEFFADSCACRQEARHFCGEHETTGAPCMEAACTDIPFGSYAVIHTAAFRQYAPASSQRHSLSHGQTATQTPCIAPQLVVGSGIMPQTTAPPIRASLSAGVQLRC